MPCSLCRNILSILLLAPASAVSAQAPLMTVRSESLDTTITKQVHGRYLVYLPRDYSASTTRWPLVLFLHGSGERGEDLTRVTVHGPPKLAATQDLPFIIIAPQVPDGEIWSADALLAILDHVQGTLRVDLDRVYVTGLSMGGFGAWEVAMAAPGRFAAVVPISGGGNPVGACKLGRVPVRIYHGDQDNVIPASWSTVMKQWIDQCHGNASLIMYHGVDHDAWTQTYADPAFWTWLLAQRRDSSE